MVVVEWMPEVEVDGGSEGDERAEMCSTVFGRSKEGGRAGGSWFSFPGTSGGPAPR